MNTKLVLLEVLRNIALNKDGARWTGLGICSCAKTAVATRARIDGRCPRTEAHETQKWLEAAFDDMRLNRAYPVKHPTMSNSYAYNSGIPFWEGEYGVNRCHLLNLLIIKLQAEIATERV